MANGLAPTWALVGYGPIWFLSPFLPDPIWESF